MNIEEITKTKGEIQMMKAATIGAVTHTHTHGNLINNKKINIYTIFMYSLHGKNLFAKNI